MKKKLNINGQYPQLETPVVKERKFLSLFTGNIKHIKEEAYNPPILKESGNSFVYKTES